MIKMSVWQFSELHTQEQKSAQALYFNKTLRFYTHVHNSTIHNGQKVEATLMAIPLTMSTGLFPPPTTILYASDNFNSS